MGARATLTPTANQEWYHTCTAIAKIAMSREPLPSRHAVNKFVPGVGPQTDSRLQQMDQGAGSNNAPPARDQFCSAAASMLVALLKHEEAADAAGGGAEARLCPKSTLITRAAALCAFRWATKK